MSAPNDPMTLLTTMDNVNMQADALRGLLESLGIATHVVSTLKQDVSQFILGQSFKDRFDYDIYVPESRLAEAQAILAAPPEYEWPEGLEPADDGEPSEV